MRFADHLGVILRENRCTSMGVECGHRPQLMDATLQGTETARQIEERINEKPRGDCSPEPIRMPRAASLHSTATLNERVKVRTMIDPKQKLGNSLHRFEA